MQTIAAASMASTSSLQPIGKTKFNNALSVCRWQWCSESFDSSDLLVEHVLQAHIRTAKPMKRRDVEVHYRAQDGASFEDSMPFMMTQDDGQGGGMHLDFDGPSTLGLADAPSLPSTPSSNSSSPTDVDNIAESLIMPSPITPVAQRAFSPRRLQLSIETPSTSPSAFGFQSLTQNSSPSHTPDFSLVPARSPTTNERVAEFVGKRRRSPTSERTPVGGPSSEGSSSAALPWVDGMHQESMFSTATGGVVMNLNSFIGNPPSLTNGQRANPLTRNPLRKPISKTVSTPLTNVLRQQRRNKSRNNSEDSETARASNVVNTTNTTNTTNNNDWKSEYCLKFQKDLALVRELDTQRNVVNASLSNMDHYTYTPRNGVGGQINDNHFTSADGVVFKLADIQTHELGSVTMPLAPEPQSEPINAATKKKKASKAKSKSKSKSKSPATPTTAQNPTLQAAEPPAPAVQSTSDTALPVKKESPPSTPVSSSKAPPDDSSSPDLPLSKERPSSSFINADDFLGEPFSSMLEKQEESIWQMQTQAPYDFDSQPVESQWKPFADSQ